MKKNGMKTEVKKISYVTGVDCTGQPVTVNHFVEIRTDNGSSVVKPEKKADAKTASTMYDKSKKRTTKRHCGQSQKDIRINHK